MHSYIEQLDRAQHNRTECRDLQFKKYHHQHSQCAHYPCSVISLHKNVFALVHAGLKNNLNQTSIKKKILPKSGTYAS